MAGKTYQFYCDYCGYKKVTQGGEDVKTMYEYTRCPTPRGIPQRNPQSKKIETPDPLKRKRAFRCPSCGRMISAKQVKVLEIKEKRIPQELSQEDLTKRIIKRFDLIYGEDDEEEDYPFGH